MLKLPIRGRGLDALFDWSKEVARAVDALTLGALSSGLPAGYVDGLKLVWSSVTDVQVEAGSARDSTDAADIVLESARTVSIASSDAGGLDTGSEASGTWYAVYVIGKADGTSDVLLSASFTDPVLPPGFQYFRRVGAVKNNGSSDLANFRQTGSGRTRECWFDKFGGDIGILLSNGQSTTAATVDCSAGIPPCGVAGLFYYNYINNVSVGYHFKLLVDGSAEQFLFRPGDLSATTRIGSTPFLPCNSDREIEYLVSSVGSASHELDLFIHAWKDEL